MNKPPRLIQEEKKKKINKKKDSVGFLFQRVYIEEEKLFATQIDYVIAIYTLFIHPFLHQPALCVNLLEKKYLH